MLDRIFRSLGARDTDERTPSEVEQDRLWKEKERRLRDIYGNGEQDVRARIEGEIQEMTNLLDQYRVIELSDEELRQRRAADMVGTKGILGYQGWSSVGTKERFLDFYKDIRGKTAVLTPSLMKTVIAAHHPIDYPSLQTIVEDISKYNEMVVFANVLGLISEEEVGSRLKDVGLIDIRQLTENFKPVINQSPWPWRY